MSLENDRIKALIERIENDLIADGVEKKNIYTSSQDGLGNYDSFFDILVDAKLEGKEITAQGVFENMKSQINYLRSVIADAERAYKAEVMKVRDSEDMVLELRDRLENLKIERDRD